MNRRRAALKVARIPGMGAKLMLIVPSSVAEEFSQSMTRRKGSKRSSRPKSRCADCGLDTTPCTGRRGCRHGGKWEYYMVKGRVWHAAGMPASDPQHPGRSGYLCVACLETRLGRLLCPQDFTDVSINDPDNPWHTPRLLGRLLAVREVLRRYHQLRREL